MYVGGSILSNRCEKCGRLNCTRCQYRTCLSCKETFTDRHNVDMIADYGVCIQCGIAMTEKYMPKPNIEQPRKPGEVA